MCLTIIFPLCACPYSRDVLNMSAHRKEEISYKKYLSCGKSCHIIGEAKAGAGEGTTWAGTGAGAGTGTGAGVGAETRVKVGAW